jgi:glycosyltransferase involved in cell wall biosynthesis
MIVSVVIPTYNSEKYVGEALESIFTQTMALSEVICVDDASSDKTVSLIKSQFPRAKIILNSKNAGPGYCRNQGILNSTGTFVAFLDSDDCWAPDKTEEQTQLFRADQAMEMVGGLTENFEMQGGKHQLTPVPYFNAYMSSFIIKRETFKKIGLFNADLRLSEDQDWFLRAREGDVKMKILDRTVLMKRIHESNMTKDISFQESGMIDVLKKSLDRRRKSSQIKDLKSLNPR